MVVEAAAAAAILRRAEKKRKSLAAQLVDEEFPDLSLAKLDAVKYSTIAQR